MAIRSSPHVLHTCIAPISGRRLLHVALCKLTAIKHASELVALAASHNHVEVLHIPRLARVRNCNSSFKPTNACVVVVAALLFWPARLNDLLFYPSWPISPPLSTVYIRSPLFSLHFHTHTTSNRAPVSLSVRVSGVPSCVRSFTVLQSCSIGRRSTSRYGC